MILMTIREDGCSEEQRITIQQQIIDRQGRHERIADNEMISMISLTIM